MNDIITVLKETNKELEQIAEKHFKKADIRDFPQLDPKYFPDVSKLDSWQGEYEAAVQAFNKNIGLPKSRLTNKEATLVPYQIQYEFEVEKYHYELVNKTRKGGFTDGRIRAIARQIFHRYAEHDTMIVAGNELTIAMEVLDRFDELFEHGITDRYGKKWRYGDIIMRYVRSPQPIVEFYNGARVFCFAASKQGRAQSFRGPDDVISIFMTEAAHSGATDDYPIYNALTPNLANRSDGDLVFETTPNGKRGFFYDVWTDAIAGKNHYHTLQVDYTQAVKYGVLSKQYIEAQRKDPRVDFEQEYCCKFTTTKRATIPEALIDAMPEVHAQDLSSFLGYNSQS
jgi:hypothetical protein